MHVYDVRYGSLLYLVGEEEAQPKDHNAGVSPTVAYRMSRDTYYRQFVIEHKTVSYHPESWSAERPMIWRSNVSSANGYGPVAENIISSLLTQGIHMVFPGAVSDGVASGGGYVHPEVLPALWLASAPDYLETSTDSRLAGVIERSWIYTMLETTWLPSS